MSRYLNLNISDVCVQNWTRSFASATHPLVSSSSSGTSCIPTICSGFLPPRASFTVMKWCRCAGNMRWETEGKASCLHLQAYSTVWSRPFVNVFLSFDWFLSPISSQPALVLSQPIVAVSREMWWFVSLEMLFCCSLQALILCVTAV